MRKRKSSSTNASTSNIRLQKPAEDEAKKLYDDQDHHEMKAVDTSLLRQEAKKLYDDQDHHEMKAVDASPQRHLPDIVIHKIFQLIPTRLAVRASLVCKQWENIWSLEVPTLDFDDELDGGNPCDDHELSPRAKLFIRYLEKCLKHYERSQKKNVALDQFRLRIASYGSELIGAPSVDKWLIFAVDRSVQELDISLPLRKKLDDHGVDESEIRYYCMPSQTLVSASSLTSLNLEYVRLENIINRSYKSWDPPEPESLFPSLKTMSLKAVIFKEESCVYWLITACPSIESLSLTSCSFSSSTSNQYWVIFVSSPTLKSLQIMNCNALDVKIEETTNLESFTFLSELSVPNVINLDECHKLKYIHISAQHLKCLRFSGILQDSLKATIDTPNLKFFYFHGYLKPHVIFSKAPNLAVASIKLSWDKEDPITPCWPSKNIPALRDFLPNFDCSERIDMYVYDDDAAEALVFQETFTETSSPPFSSVKRLMVCIGRTPRVEAIDFNLDRTFDWMAPSAETIAREEFDDDDDDDYLDE